MKKIWAICVVLLCGLPWAGAAAAAQGKEFTNSIEMEFVLIPAGSFQMGADKSFEEASDDETPRHQVTLSNPFYMGKYEVTQEQWAALMTGNPSKFKGRTRPVEQVSWNDAQKFIAALNKKEGKSYRLPTEAEWEYAVRAGTKTAYSFGDDKNMLSRYAWWDGNSGRETHPVGQLAANAWGLYDMHGNVWEWCQDWYGEKYYGSSLATDPLGPSTYSYRVLRGGSWGNGPGYLRSASRNGNSPGHAAADLGFRLVLPIQQMKGSQAEQAQQAAAGKAVAASSGTGGSAGEIAEAQEKQRRAAEETKQATERAAQQQREADQAAQQARKTRSNACDGLYPGKPVSIKSRNLLHLGATVSVVIIGVDSASEQVSMRTVDSGFTQETSCSSFKSQMR